MTVVLKNAINISQNFDLNVIPKIAIADRWTTISLDDRFIGRMNARMNAR